MPIGAPQRLRRAAGEPPSPALADAAEIGRAPAAHAALHARQLRRVRASGAAVVENRSWKRPASRRHGEVAQRRAARGDGVLEHSADCRSQGDARLRSGFTRPRQAGGRPLRREAGPEQRLRDVDVAEAGNDALVHEEGLEVGGAAGGAAREVVGRQRAAGPAARRRARRTAGELRAPPPGRAA